MRLTDDLYLEPDRWGNWWLKRFPYDGPIQPMCKCRTEKKARKRAISWQKQINKDRAKAAFAEQWILDHPDHEEACEIPL